MPVPVAVAPLGLVLLGLASAFNVGALYSMAKGVPGSSAAPGVSMKIRLMILNAIDSELRQFSAVATKSVKPMILAAIGEELTKMRAWRDATAAAVAAAGVAERTNRALAEAAVQAAAIEGRRRAADEARIAQAAAVAAADAEASRPAREGRERALAEIAKKTAEAAAAAAAAPIAVSSPAAPAAAPVDSVEALAADIGSLSPPPAVPDATVPTPQSPLPPTEPAQPSLQPAPGLAIGPSATLPGPAEQADAAAGLAPVVADGATTLLPRHLVEDTDEEAFQDLKNTQVAALNKQLQSTGVGVEEEAIRLIDSGYPVIGSNKNGMTPLMIASQRLMLPVVKAILAKLARYAKTEREADAAKRSEANKVNKYKQTALDLVNSLPVGIKTHTQYVNSLLGPGAAEANLQRQLDDAEIELSRVRAAQAMNAEDAARKEGAFSFSPANVVYPKGGRNIFTSDRSDIVKLLTPITEPLAVRAQRADIYEPSTTHDPAAGRAFRKLERAGVKDPPPPAGLVLRYPRLPLPPAPTTVGGRRHRTPKRRRGRKSRNSTFRRHRKH